MLKPQIILNIAQVNPKFTCLMVQKYKYWHLWRSRICSSTTSTGTQFTCFTSTKVLILTLTRGCLCAAVSPAALNFCSCASVFVLLYCSWASVFVLLYAVCVQLFHQRHSTSSAARMFPQQQTNTEELVRSLLVLLLQKYKYHAQRGCCRNSRPTPRNWYAVYLLY